MSASGGSEKIHMMHTRLSSRTSFLDLPAEVRNQTYAHIARSYWLHVHRQYHILLGWVLVCTFHNSPWPLLRTCQAIRIEALPVMNANLTITTKGDFDFSGGRSVRDLGPHKNKMVDAFAMARTIKILGDRYLGRTMTYCMGLKELRELMFDVDISRELLPPSMKKGDNIDQAIAQKIMRRVSRFFLLHERIESSECTRIAKAEATRAQMEANNSVQRLWFRVRLKRMAASERRGSRRPSAPTWR